MTMNPPENHDPNIQNPQYGYSVNDGVTNDQSNYVHSPLQGAPHTGAQELAHDLHNDPMQAPPEFSSADAILLEHAKASGIPVIENPHHELDPAAVRAIPEDTGVIGIGYHEGFLIIAWPKIPTPNEIDHVQSKAGMPIRVAVATETAFQSLWQQADIARKQRLSLVEDILEQALKQKGSDIHLSVGTQPLTRVGGHLAPLDGFSVLTSADMDEIVEYLAGPEPLREGFSGDLDLACTYGNWRFRANVFLQRDSLAVALRIIPNAIPPLDTLGLPETMKQFASLRQGVVLVCGPTGSGKSTSLAALINKINHERDEHIVTIEDPIEYIHASVKSLIQQREVGEDTKSFAMAMRSVLRQDPDVILVGEMRDLETISTALTAAETGHLVFSTLHATDAPGVIDRVIDAFPKNEQAQIRVQLANTLEGIVCQSLLPHAEDPSRRVVICELMVVTSAIRAFIREGNTHQIPTALQTGIEEFGMLPRDLSLARAVVNGDISDKVARDWARDPASYREYLNKVRQGQRI
ncbi:MAG: PilT/PilU family type 4a pilus ATPase [Acidimicrobiia bacterium]